MTLLIISDDLTGALDTGIQFAQYGANTKIITTSEDEKYFFTDNDTEVLVIDAETRHLSGEQAYRRVYKLTEAAVLAGISHIYKKTDSGLRGNIGSELKALLDASHEQFLPFIPAYPQMNRVTIEGFHYIDGQPISESVFGRDPFEPVVSSEIRKLFSRTDTKTVILNRSRTYQTDFKNPTIGIFDARSDEDIMRISTHLNNRNQLKVMAGCAGFASFLPQLLKLQKMKTSMPRIDPKLLVMCGSLNPISRSQLEYAQRQGFMRIMLTPEQELKEDYLLSEDGVRWLKSLEAALKENQVVMLDTGISDLRPVNDYLADNHISLSDARVRIAATLGKIVKMLLDIHQNHSLMIIGGDTLLGFFNQIGCKEIYPVCELEAGIVLSYIDYGDRKLWIISKSGGFGREDTIYRIAGRLRQKEDKSC